MKAISLYSGAGGMDVGFHRAGFEITHACEINRIAAATLAANFPQTSVAVAPVSTFLGGLRPGQATLVFGGPPCQGYSVAGKMNPADPRSAEVWSFLKVVGRVRPACFVMENVDALGALERWRGTLTAIRERALEIGYVTHVEILNASDYGVPQARKRMIMFGSATLSERELSETCSAYLRRMANLRRSRTVREVLERLGPAGTDHNPITCTADIRFAARPILRRSPYAGMMFNGAGRPLRLDAPSTTLAASAGGNKTHFIDENEIFRGQPSYVEEYHSQLMAGGLPRAGSAPGFLRRLTVRESMALHTFPESHVFHGSKSAQYRQIGNALPCDLAEVVAACAVTVIDRSAMSIGKAA